MRKVARDATAAGQALEDALYALADSRIDETQSGRFILSTSANGQTVSYSVPTIFAPGITFGPADIVVMISELIDLYEAASAALGDSPSDAAIATEMLDRIRAVTSVRSDFTSIRVGYS